MVQRKECEVAAERRTWVKLLGVASDLLDMERDNIEGTKAYWE